MNNEEILKENDGKKFDLVLMNPPYDNGLHLRFFKKCCEICDKMVSIQPCNWLFLKSKQKRTQEVRELVDKYYTEIEILDNIKQYKIFGDGVDTSKTVLSISCINMLNQDSKILIDGLRDNLKTSEYNNIDDVKLFGTNKIWESLYKKLVIGTKDKLESHAYVYKDLPGIIAYFQKVGKTVDRGTNEFDGKYVVSHGTLGPRAANKGIEVKNYYTLAPINSSFNNPSKYEDVKDNLKVFYVFDTKEEALNFINYTKTDFFRSIIYMTKLGGATICADQYCPWQDFKEKWTDEKLFKKYNITLEEQKKIREVLPDYYNIRGNIDDVDGNGYYDVNDFLNMKNEEILKENNGKKFDICLMNPPYNNGLHLQFFSKCSNITNKMVCVHPCNWLFLESTQKRTKEVRNIVNTNGANIEIYREGSNIFGKEVNFKSNIAITNIDFNNKTNIIITGLGNNKSIYKSINDVKLFGQDPIWESIYKKIIEDKENKLEIHAYVYKDLPRIIAYFQKVGKTVDRNNCNDLIGKYVCNHGTMSGNISKQGGWSDDFTAIIGKGAKWMKPQKFEDVKDDLKIFYVFDTKEEAQNMIDYLKTDFVRSILFMTKIGQANIVCDKYAPWQDFKEKWTDEKLFKKYNITLEEQKKIREVLPDYYGIRK